MVGVKMTVIKIMPVVVDMGKSAVLGRCVLMAVQMRISLMLFICGIVMLVLMSMGGPLSVIMLFMVIIMAMAMMIVLMGTLVMAAVPVMVMCLFIA
jgi:hypothetical protein